ncbi:lipid A deacylase LpxR family protein [Vreelandella jeotgali]|uniref:lipid A deacylase LpxR family protein n=1 Tax=Vreelandella jeotgali TaxID=553386 RepID=UPI00037E7D42|nr:lipid A deacylase LpxR family protein [Halomonas jeotgali]
MPRPRCLWPTVVSALTALLIPALAPASDEALSLEVTNDGMISVDDGHYTSGVKLGYSFRPEAAHWTQRFSRWLPDTLIQQADRAEYRLVQQIYTPMNIRASRLLENDRPYAGLVYGGASLYGEQSRPNGRTTTDLHLDVGMVGPSSLADSIQQEVHRLTGSNRPQGWDHQIGDEAIVNLGMRRQWWHESPLASKQLAWGPEASIALGNLYTYASTGYYLRFGDAARSVPTLTPNSASSAGFDAADGFRWYVFGGVEGYYMARNLLLDGNTFSSSHSVDRREWVGDLSAGLSLAWDDWQMRFTALQRSREFHGQQDPDRFAALTFSRAL